MWSKVDSNYNASVTKEIIMYKKTINPSNYSECITTLRIPEEARIHFSNHYPLSFYQNNDCNNVKEKLEQSTPFHAKCRVSEAFVIKNECNDGAVKTAFAHYDNSFKYEVNKKVAPKWLFCESRQTCTSGIHVFFSKDQAIKYDFE